MTLGYFWTLKKIIISCAAILLLITGCNKTVKIVNENQGNLKAGFRLEVKKTKKFSLDSVTAPKPQYIQVFTDSSGFRYFTFLNNYNGSIYFYDYNSLQFVRKITWDKKGPNAILRPGGYYIKSWDSIYIYNMPFIELALTNSDAKIVKKISLNGSQNRKDWPLYYPQYFPETVNPFLEAKGKLILTGQDFRSIPDSTINDFKFTALIDLKTCKVDFQNTYPTELYGSGYNWEGDLFTEVFPALHPDGNKLIYSFPVSHDLYISELGSDSYRKVYAGSNYAGTIRSFNHDDPGEIPNEVILAHWVSQDMYAAIIYDRFRNVYYRFLRKAIPNTTNRLKKEEKPITVIIMNEEFIYLGETEIGTCEEYYWQNSFVTREGLNIEYIENDYKEVNLILKVFTLKKI